MTGEPNSTAFQRMVWNEIKNIPRGGIMTYKDLAVAIGRPNSARAVANACSKNPHPIVVPCHRVIRSDGRIGGYSGPGGSKGKMELLKEEGVV
tara:strand:- start:520 stop:798 length:279 start_codon:yes stop_codon:yes gene_type:complete